jgi:hypothetical protein
LTIATAQGEHDPALAAGVLGYGLAMMATPLAIGRVHSIQDVFDEPWVLAGKTPEDLTGIYTGPGWEVETLGQGEHAGQGWVLREYTPGGDATGRMIRWHPGGGHHGPDPYWRVIDFNTKSGIIK